MVSISIRSFFPHTFYLYTYSLFLLPLIYVYPRTYTYPVTDRYRLSLLLFFCFLSFVSLQFIRTKDSFLIVMKLYQIENKNFLFFRSFFFLMAFVGLCNALFLFGFFFFEKLPIKNIQQIVNSKKQVRTGHRHFHEYCYLL